jgi:hypothetical protein
VGWSLASERVVVKLKVRREGGREGERGREGGREGRREEKLIALILKEAERCGWPLCVRK